jgi:DNA-binding beta-propeller fold protein YncE
MQDTTTKPAGLADNHTHGRLFVLDLSGGRIFSLNPEGFDQQVIVTECGHPDGVAVDVAAGHIYWTNMGVPAVNDGSIERADLDGQNRTTIVPTGARSRQSSSSSRDRAGSCIGGIARGCGSCGATSMVRT